MRRAVAALIAVNRAVVATAMFDKSTVLRGRQFLRVLMAKS